MVFGRLLCLFNRHRPTRKTVRWVGTRYHGTCRWCGKSIERKSKGDWRTAAAPVHEPPQN